ncbi:MAG TPA: VOC family protein [Chloroflexia bacterium]|nr:VOC family protein [Chloroflexia bacterium]
MTNFGEAAAPAVLHPDTAMGQVALTVADLDRSIRFYTQSLGFQVLARDAGTATLGPEGGPGLLLLTEQPGALPAPRSATGLYHFAILLPTRADLARALYRLIETQTPLQGFADHLVSEAIYLADPDGNGIEIYRDRPRAEWPRINGAIQMATDPIDLDGLMAELGPNPSAGPGLPAGTRMGHVHLQVGDIARAAAFYVGVLGFEVVTSMPSALFVSAGGYHHHLGLNTWQSRGRGAPPAGRAGLRDFIVVLPDRAEQDRVVARLEAAGIPVTREGGAVVAPDPWGTQVRLVVAPAPTGAEPAATLAESR